MNPYFLHNIMYMSQLNCDLTAITVNRFKTALFKFELKRNERLENQSNASLKGKARIGNGKQKGIVFETCKKCIEH